MQKTNVKKDNQILHDNLRWPSVSLVNSSISTHTQNPTKNKSRIANFNISFYTFGLPQLLPKTFPVLFNVIKKSSKNCFNAKLNYIDLPNFFIQI